jgi:hypothetical protein
MIHDSPAKQNALEKANILYVPYFAQYFEFHTVLFQNLTVQYVLEDDLVTVFLTLQYAI